MGMGCGPGQAVRHPCELLSRLFPEPAQALGFGEQLQPAAPNATWQRLPGICPHGHTLTGAVDGHPQVDLPVVVTGAAATKLASELFGGCFREVPAQNRPVEGLRCQ